MAAYLQGEAGAPYEFGVKVPITTTLKEGFVLGARSMPGNPYDRHTLREALEQASLLSVILLKSEIEVDGTASQEEFKQAGHLQRRRLAATSAPAAPHWWTVQQNFFRTKR